MTNVCEVQPMTTQESSEPTLQQRLSLLVENGVNRFNPVRFYYIEAMAKRAANQAEAIAGIVENKALMALADYQVEFAQAKEEAAERTERVATQYPDSAQRVNKLFSNNEFKAVKRLETQLQRDQKPTQQSSLASLTQRLIQDESLFDKNPVKDSFEDVLRQQEQDLIRSINNTATSSKVAPPTELKSVRLFRKSWTKISTDNQVQQAIKDSPQDPGPLNQDMLASRSLSIMRDLSPQYASRFISYLETVFWLEQAGAPPESATTKKKGKASKKSSRKRKK
jgi:Protein of unknown function (DUF2894)